jgi:flagellar protein FlaF
MLVKDLGRASNGLPDALKQQLISLGLWAMRYSTLAILQKLPVAPLLDVNRNIMEGLMMQASRPDTAAPGRVETAI